jgi:ribosomal 50S subunit-recycling heat shock protein
MRLDKFLQLSRLVKRRTVANALCDSANVLINEKAAKAGTEVKAGDVITLRFGNRIVRARVELVPAKNIPAPNSGTNQYVTLLEDTPLKGEPII